jgi:fructokinase
MHKIFTIGETVYDIVFRDAKPVAAIPGGAILNSSVSLGRLKLPVCYITELGKDEIGDLIFGFLKDNGVETSFINRFEDGKTALSLAFLDENKKASYSFYKQYPEKRLTADFPVPGEDDIVLFGPFFSLLDEVRKPLTSFIGNAGGSGSLIIYDPNYRKPHGSELPNLQRYLKDNISFADIVRGSDEDFHFICGAKNADDAFDFVRKNGCSFLIYTVGGEKVEFRSEKFSFSVPVTQVKVVSTIGAGDSFNAGLIYALHKRKIYTDSLDAVSLETWNSIVKTAIAFGSHVCGSFDNYISKEFAEGIKSAIPDFNVGFSAG